MLQILEIIILFGSAIVIPIIVEMPISTMLGSHFNPGDIRLNPNYKRINFASFAIPIFIALTFYMIKEQSQLIEWQFYLITIVLLFLISLTLRPISTLLYSTEVMFHHPPPRITLSRISIISIFFLMALTFTLHFIYTKIKLLLFIDLISVIVLITVIRTFSSLMFSKRAPITGVLLESIMFSGVIYIFTKVHNSSSFNLLYSIYSSTIYFFITGGGLLLKYLENTTEHIEYTQKFGKYYEELIKRIKMVINSQITGYVFFVMGLFYGLVFSLEKKFDESRTITISTSFALIALLCSLIIYLLIISYKMSAPMYPKISGFWSSGL